MKFFEKLILYIIVFLVIFVLGILIYKEFKKVPLILAKKEVKKENTEVENLKIRIKTMENEIQNLEKSTAIQNCNETIAKQREEIYLVVDKLDSINNNMRSNEQDIKNIFYIFDEVGKVFSIKAYDKVKEKDKKIIVKKEKDTLK
ncbi:MAG: hypothetical protein B6I24_03550 [Bacteroidetes bacterium 4572_128]|nr:MAG: hypothetical protein B6I24_03550 [Bacteroidetes bacterium 4572_128]